MATNGNGLSAGEAAGILTSRIPHSETWGPCAPDPYGAYDLEPRARVRRVLYCVTPTEAGVRHFRDGGYDLLVSHHPFRVGVPQVILHTPLDCCAGGLNDMWADALGIQDWAHFHENLGWFGEIEPLSFADLRSRVASFAGGAIAGGAWCEDPAGPPIASVVVCSGFGGMVTRLAQRSGAECYIFGQATAPLSSMGFRAAIEVGHTRSERMGVRLVRGILGRHGVSVESMPARLDVFGDEAFSGSMAVHHAQG